MSNATPSADVAPSLIALDATAKIVSATGERTVALEEFFRGPGQTIMDPDEILTEITIPKTRPRLVGEYIKFSPRDMMDSGICRRSGSVRGRRKRKKMRRRSDCSRRGSADTDPREKCGSDIGRSNPHRKLAAKAGDEAAKESKPISDVRSSADYRRAMVGAMTKRAMLNASVPRMGKMSWCDRRDRRY